MKKKPIIIIVVVAVIAIALAGGVIFGMKLSGGDGKEKEIDILSEEVQQLEIGEMYSNLAESKKIAKLNLTIAVGDAELFTLMESRMPLIKDEINKSIRAKTEENIVGLKGQVDLKNELISSLNEIFKTKGVLDIYFNELIVQ